MQTAGWLPDPTGRHGLRYHDGIRWTDRVADNGVSAIDPMQLAKAGGANRDKTRRGAIIGAIALGLVLVGAALTFVALTVHGDIDTSNETAADAPAGTIRQLSPCEATLATVRASAVAYYSDHDGVWPIRFSDLVPNYMSVRPGTTVVNEVTMAGGGWTITLTGGGRVETRFVDVGC